MEDNVVHVSNQPEALNAGSPNAIDESHVSPADHDMGEAPAEEQELDVQERTIPQPATPTTPTFSELTQMDDAMLQDSLDPASPSQLITTHTHFNDSPAPRISFQPSDGVFIIEEQVQPVKQKPLSTSPATTPAFERYAANQNTLNLPGSPRAPPTLVVERTMGPKGFSLPTKLFENLEQWHTTHPNSTEHPCAFKKRAPTTWDNFKIYDEDADEYRLSVFQITVKGAGRRTSRYSVLVLHLENGTEELVMLSSTRAKIAKLCKGIYGMYLFAWNVTKENWEEKACAIKIWRTDKEKIIFNTQMLDEGFRRLDNSSKRKYHDKDDESNLPNTPTPMSRNQSQIAYDQENFKTPTSADYTRVLGSPFMSDNIENRRAKRDLNGQDTAQAAIHALSIQVEKNHSLVRFKLVSNDNVQSRYFDTDDADVFFRKVGEFFKPAPAGILCTYPGLDGVRYIGTGCVDEFSIFMDAIRQSFVLGEETVITEVISVSSLH
ncbi:uncharacterized protein N7529_006551 [Penicillium soppii]|uniref:uncharacterized protein n=1 Tax=Penicillium soppii TaxID=69789 RepID=UPI002547D00B|nr:uncharacterized protein N7529_006551 [Penicillium soppii]KAJ5864635.1 hypothetical protein N7529_006551 [Penicillium soppii]